MSADQKLLAELPSIANSLHLEADLASGPAKERLQRAERAVRDADNEIDQLRAKLQQPRAIPEGYVLVPRDELQVVLMALANVPNDFHQTGDQVPVRITVLNGDIFTARAMLSAVPQDQGGENVG